MFPRWPARATFFANTNFVSGTQKMFLIMFGNILCPQQMFPSLRSSETSWATMCPQQCVHVYQGLYSSIIYSPVGTHLETRRQHDCRFFCSPWNVYRIRHKHLREGKTKDQKSSIGCETKKQLLKTFQNRENQLKEVQPPKRKEGVSDHLFIFLLMDQSGVT